MPRKTLEAAIQRGMVASKAAGILRNEGFQNAVFKVQQISVGE